MTFTRFFKQFCEESGEDIWNMSLERFNAMKAQAREIYNNNKNKKDKEAEE